MAETNNIELVRQFFDAAINDPQRLDAICAPDFTLVEPDLFPSPFTSLAAYKAFLAENPFTEVTITIDRAETVAESVSLRYTFRGTVEGKPVTLVRKAHVRAGTAGFNATTAPPMSTEPKRLPNQPCLPPDRCFGATAEGKARSALRGDNVSETSRKRPTRTVARV